MSEQEFRLRATIVVGWCMMFMVLLAMFIVDLAKSAITENFGSWAEDMSEGGLLVMLVIMCIYIFIPMLVVTLRAVWFRYAVIVITILMTLFFMAHEVAHLLTGDMPFGLRHVLDFSHHILGIWVVVAATMWAKIPQNLSPAMQTTLQ